MRLGSCTDAEWQQPVQSPGQLQHSAAQIEKAQARLLARAASATASSPITIITAGVKIDQTAIEAEELGGYEDPGHSSME